MVHFAFYLMEADDRALSLTCVAIGERPEDRWLAIAETFEFLPDEECRAPSSVVPERLYRAYPCSSLDNEPGHR
jgi:hypothetical protein